MGIFLSLSKIWHSPCKIKITSYIIIGENDTFLLDRFSSKFAIFESFAWCARICSFHLMSISKYKFRRKMHIIYSYMSFINWNFDLKFPIKKIHLIKELFVFLSIHSLIYILLLTEYIMHPGLKQHCYLMYDGNRFFFFNLIRWELINESNWYIRLHIKKHLMTYFHIDCCVLFTDTFDL